MAKIIEFIGPSGIGKTTTYFALSKIWGKNKVWIPYVNCHFPVINKTHKLKSIVKKVCFKNASPYVDSVLKNRAIEEFIQENPHLINILWDAISKRERHADGCDYRFNGLKYMMSLFGRDQLIKQYVDEKYCVVDEGVIHNMGFAIKNEYNYEEQALKYLDLLIDYIGIIIYFEIKKMNEKIILKRLYERNVLCFLDRNLTEEQILARIKEVNIKDRRLVELLKRKSIPVFSVDANNTADNNSQEIKLILDSLQ